MPPRDARARGELSTVGAGVARGRAGAARSERQREAGLARSCSTRRNSPLIRSSAAALSASKRSTTTGVVFEPRARPKPSGYSTRKPSMRMTSVAPGNTAVSPEPRDQRVVLALGAGDVELRRGHRVRQRVEHRRRVGVPRQDLEQPRAGVKPVVEAVPALLEERVAAHLAGQRRADLLHLHLDQRVPGLPQQRLAAVSRHPRARGCAST